MNKPNIQPLGRIATRLLLVSATITLASCQLYSDRYMASSLLPGNDGVDYGELNLRSSESTETTSTTTVTSPSTAANMQTKALTAEPIAMLEYSLDDEVLLNLKATEAAERKMLRRTLDDLRQGHTVTINPISQAASPWTDDTLVFTTYDAELVIAWTRRMVRLGYTVTITYNQHENTYRCTAIRNKKRKNNK